MSNEHTYEEGLRDGRIAALEHMQHSQNSRLDKHESRISIQERITYGLLGAIALLEVIPLLRDVLVP